MSSANIEDDDDSEDELETIQKELNVLLLKKEELSKEEETATPTENGGTLNFHTFSSHLFCFCFLFKATVHPEIKFEY